MEELNHGLQVLLGALVVPAFTVVRKTHLNLLQFCPDSRNHVIKFEI
jgi:hypothetical protein